jgi:lipopolysaccharide biosynthesis glycosyltransferase
MTDKLCFTTCLNEKFIPGAKGTILSIRKFYTPEEADIVVFIDNIYPEFDQFCQTHSVDIQYFSSIKDWVLPLIYSQDRYKNDKTHYYHPDFALHENVPFNVDTKRDLGFHKLHHLHPLNVKAYCTGYCLLIKDYKKVVHIDSDAFLLSKIDEIFDAYAQENTVIGFDDGNDNLENLEYLYGVKKPDTWTPQTYAFNAGIVFYRNGEFIKELMKDFCFYIDSCYHYDKSGSFADQGLLRALVAVYNIQGCIQFHRLPAENWNPTWRRADTLEFQNNIWINKKNGQKQRIWHGAGEEKLWTGKYDSASVNEAWSWIGGELPPKNNKLVITKAIYGYGDKAKDVTDIIRDKKLIHNDNDSLDRTIGDPNPGVEKEITVYFRQHGQEVIKKYPKHHNIDTFIDNNLIYFTVRGKEYKEMLTYCVKSLRNIGNYNGKIIIFTNEIDENLKSINHLATFVSIQFQCHPMFDRLHAMEFINPCLYKNILALDSDVLAMKDISSLFTASDEVLYMEEPWQYIKKCSWDLIYSSHMTDEEKQKFGDFHTINAGHFCIAGNIFIDFYEKYKEECYRKRQEFGADQSALNSIIRKGLIKARPFSKNDICMPTQTKEEYFNKYSLLHFAGYSGRLEKIKQLYENTISKSQSKIL